MLLLYLLKNNCVDPSKYAGKSNKIEYQIFISKNINKNEKGTKAI